MDVATSDSVTNGFGQFCKRGLIFGFLILVLFEVLGLMYFGDFDLWDLGSQDMDFLGIGELWILGLLGLGKDMATAILYGPALFLGPSV